ncbi:MAG: FTR1 family iron permease [Negativicutes bacterium]|nr:FTR1 family iron permease [Negativicutes bacterium]
MRKLLLILLVPLLLAVTCQSAALAAGSWGKVVDRIDKTMAQSLDVYKKGDVEKAKNLVNEAYFSIYEKEGLERAIKSKISGRRATTEEYKFSTIRKLMTNQAPDSQIKKEITELSKMMRQDAVQLGSKQQNPLETFLSAFLILVREGFEAILVIGAIAAYLIKSGNGAKTRVVYFSSAGAILASFLTAIALQKVFSISGASQEILEGATMLVAVVVLFFVSHWMVGKSEANAWQNYIEGKVQSSLSGGSTLSLGAAAFLAVYREGAETVLFYQALFSEAAEHMEMVWLGFGLGCLALVIIFLLIRYGSMKMPLKPFFRGTSILLYIMAISFAGGGVKELQEGGIVGVTPVPGMESIDLLGIYPTWETLLPQILLVVLAIGGVIYQRRKQGA